MPTHYETLGVKRSATAGEIRSAYRRVVLAHHPDRSKTTDSKAKFRAATDAYEILNDPEKRQKYDRELEARETYQATSARIKVNPAPGSPSRGSAATQPSASKTADRPVRPIGEDLTKLAVLFGRGQAHLAETLARQILSRDARQPLPYAVLGDIARSRNDLNEAARLYAYAAQFDPLNTAYQQRYEQLLADSALITTRRGAEVRGIEANAGVVMGGTVFALGLAGIAIAMNNLVTQILILGLAGIALGTALAVGRAVDRLSLVAWSPTSGFTAAGFLLVCWLPNLVFGMLATAVLFLTQRLQDRSVFAYGSGLSGLVLVAWVGVWTRSDLVPSLTFFAIVSPVVALAMMLGWRFGEAVGRG